MIRRATFLIMAAVLALILGAAPWVIYMLGVLVVLVISIGEEEK